MVTTAGRPMNPETWRRDAEVQIGQIILRASTKRITSDFLRRQVYLQRGPSETVLTTPVHWIGPYYFGFSGTIRPKDAEVLVWFTDRRDDPRPPTIRREPGNRLTRDEFRAGVAENRRRAAEANGGPYIPFMVIAKYARVRQRGNPFFRDGARTSAREWKSAVQRSFRNLVRSFAISERDVARVT